MSRAHSVLGNYQILYLFSMKGCRFVWGSARLEIASTGSGTQD